MSFSASSLLRRIGLLLPLADTVFEPDFYCYIPDRWGVHTAFPAARILPDLRKLFPFPVIASNQVTIEKAIAAAKEQPKALSTTNEVS